MAATLSGVKNPSSPAPNTTSGPPLSSGPHTPALSQRAPPAGRHQEDDEDDRWGGGGVNGRRRRHSLPNLHEEVASEHWKRRSKRRGGVYHAPRASRPVPPGHRPGPQPAARRYDETMGRAD